MPEAYKSNIKSEFFRYDLIVSHKDLLLGGSRIDLAALIIQKAIKDFLVEHGDAYFFIPLSLLLNDGAHQYFRSYNINHIRFALRKVFDLNDSDIFPAISTRYGLVHFKRNVKAAFPVPYIRYENGTWKNYIARPILRPTDPLSVLSLNNVDPLTDFEPILLSRKSTPRQGINTCGANRVFFFQTCDAIDASTCLLNGETKLPSRYIYPLLTSKNFAEKRCIPYRWVLLPYTTNGRPLGEDQILGEPGLWKYLKWHEKLLRSRKGTLIGTWIRRGYWWALLGVGPYNFMCYKIVWEAYGKSRFRPILVRGRWQVNQSLQAYIPVANCREARWILRKLLDPAIESYLSSLQMQGTMNWAQPGKIRKLLRFRET